MSRRLTIAPGREDVGTRDQTAMVRVGPRGRSGVFSPRCRVFRIVPQPACGLDRGPPEDDLKLAGMLVGIPVLFDGGREGQAIHGCLSIAPAQADRGVIARQGGGVMRQAPASLIHEARA